MVHRRIERIVGIVLLAAALAWIAMLFGFASGFLSDDPPAVSPYGSIADVGWFGPPPAAVAGL